MTLNVHSIESFSTVDGPGIRYVVFLKGCSFRCIYCHNVDTWSADGGKPIETSDILWEVKKNIAYLAPNKGGVTVSGGDPLEQPEAITELFTEVRTLPLTTCLDTAGYRLDGPVKKLLSVTDLVLLDIKQPIDSRHKELTGHGNSTVLLFQDHLDENTIPYWIRFTVVEGVNDDAETLAALKQRVNGRTSMEKFEVLPYHTLGAYKWKELGMKSALEGKPPASQKTVDAVYRAVGVS
ncbi:MAG: pyruvate formate-lyase-activating protein [Spirochaetota bacterium]